MSDRLGIVIEALLFITDELSIKYSTDKATKKKRKLLNVGCWLSRVCGAPTSSTYTPCLYNAGESAG